MQNLITIIAANVETITETNRVAYEKRLERVEEAYRVENNNISPNIDNKGRLHAPCDGYCIPTIRLEACSFEECYSEKLFGKGEFLPNPIRDDEFLFFTGGKIERKFTASIRLEGADFIEAFKTLADDSKDKAYSIKFSRVWNYKGENCCFVTVQSCWVSVTNMFKNQVEILVEAKKAAKAKSEPVKEVKVKGVAPVGRSTVKGVIIGFKTESGYMDGTFVHKMLIELENNATVYGTIPAKIIEAEKGDTVEFTATFEQSDDNTHGYYKRPAKPSIVKTAKETVSA